MARKTCVATALAVAAFITASFVERRVIWWPAETV